MIRYLLLLVILCVETTYLHAQGLYMPRDVKRAFKKETRSPDGRPGKNYWQNHGRYNISVVISPPARTVHGREEITYFNESPDSLRTLFIKMILNIHKPGAVRLSPETPDYLTAGAVIDSFSIAGRTQPWADRYGNTTKPVRLPKTLLPHDSVKLGFSWHYDVSQKSNREGMIDPTTYFLAYFYPRVAVYDDYAGWDTQEFNDALEFYNDFNEYNLSVTVPANYVVWATGDFANPAEVLQPAVAARYAKSLTTDEILHVATLADMQTSLVTQQRAQNRWVFTASNISDVAVGISDHFVWDASSVVVDAATGRRASVQAAFNDTATDFHSMVYFGRRALDWLSTQWPGIPYPFSKSTVFQGYADMEYPMMVNDNTTPDTTFSRFVVEHEIAHTYMPFYMGINETRYGFMDEGWATTFELLLNRARMERDKADGFYKQFRVAQWTHARSPDEDMPIITPGANQSGGGLGSNQYGKPSLAYLALKDLLGDVVFKKALHEYMSRWHGKHPLPWDFFNSFTDASGQKLDWFWNNWFFSQYYIDLAVKGVSQQKNKYTISIENHGGMAIPFDVIITYVGDDRETLHQTPAVWQANQKEITITGTLKKAIKSVELDGGIFMDAEEGDNLWRR